MPEDLGGLPAGRPVQALRQGVQDERTDSPT